MLHKNIIKLAALLWCVLTVASCTNEDFDKGSSGPDVPKGLPVTLKLNIGTPEVPVVETKALDNGDKFGSINDLAVLVYDEKGENPVVTYVPGNGGTEVTGIKFNAKTGKHKIYVLTNVGSEDAANAYTTERALLAAQFESATPGGGEMMLGFVSDKSYADSRTQYDSGQNNVIDITGDGNYYAKVVPPYSKITFKITKNLPSDKHVYLAITEVNVRHLPVKYSLLPYEKWTMNNGVENNNVNLYSNPSAKPEEEVGELATGKNFYMYENLQGVNNTGNADPMLKTPAGLTVPTSGDGKIDYATWFQKWTSVPCTYIEVKGHYTIFTSEGNVNHVGDGEINYRFFLGENSTSDFNIKRNTHYDVTLAFTGLAGKNELQYEWRVQADLEHSTFYPKGELIIDGSMEDFPFWIINNAPGSFSVTTTGESSSDMQLGYIDEYNNMQNPSDFNDNYVPVPIPKEGEFQQYFVRSVNLGVMGTDSYKKGDVNTYRLDGTGQYYTMLSDNFDARDLNIAGRIYRIREFTLFSGGVSKLIVKEYPLLCLTNETDISSANSKAKYAQRVNRPKGLVGKADAEKICEGSASGNFYTYLPTLDEFTSLISFEKGFFKPDLGTPYWTKSGVYSWTDSGPVKSSESKAYVRCVYKSHANTN